MGTVTTIGLDLAKNIFQVHGVDDVGNVVLRRTLRRRQVADFFAQLPPCLVAMESCSTSQFWARKLAELGHQPRLIPPQFVKPYLMTNKNDANDAAAICEAVRRPQMRFVPLKTRDQQSILAVHRVREGWIKARTACANQIRALMAEAGVVLPQGISQIFRHAGERVTDPVKAVPDLIRDLVLRLLEHLRYLQQRIAELELIIEVWHRRNGDSQRLAAIPGIGVITATALVATIGDARQFKSGRQLAAWIGIVPRQHSSGGKGRLLGISKRGDVYLRTLLIHGARVVLRHLAKRRDGDGAWLARLASRSHPNVAATALANRHARIVWALLAYGRSYDPGFVGHGSE